MKFYSPSLSEREKIHQSYSSAFPKDEQRDEGDFWALFQNPNAEILTIYNAENFIGYLVLWHLSETVFIEHFEVFEEFRGQSLGTRVLEFLKQKHSQIILETEPAEFHTIAERRVNFYERNGFTILKKDYIQPSYGEGKNPINLWLMGTFIPNDLAKLVSEIYQIVYQK
ncbi:MAG: GNAT family N-acetyltransferase [Flavobacteriaceae bacterium]|nr:GNAT family N-acetyltransferase [Flavobacteriaceae bacterium]